MLYDRTIFVYTILFKKIKNMKNKKLSDQRENQEIIFGIHPLLEFLSAKKRPLYSIYTTQPTPKAWPQILRLLPANTKIQYVSKQILTRLAETDDHQNVVAITKPLPMRHRCFDPQKYPYIVLLDGIQDTRNMGAIIRSAYCTGISGIVIPAKRSAPMSGATYKASAGLAEHVEIYQPETSYKAALEIKAAGYNLYLAALGGKNAIEIDYKTPLCVVIGNESLGISSEILKLGEKVTLPQRKPDISYNASVAAGIMLFLVATKAKIL
jgi:23S rRNA (guanosine2251-2'-O)-methyltransferase